MTGVRKADWSVWSEVGCYQIKMVLVRWLVSFDRSVKIVRSVVVNCRDESRWQTRISESVAEDSLYNIVLKDIEQHSSQLFGLWVDGVHQCDFGMNEIASLTKMQNLNFIWFFLSELLYRNATLINITFVWHQREYSCDTNRYANKIWAISASKVAISVSPFLWLGLLDVNFKLYLG